jgi:hypothetical protein
MNDDELKEAFAAAVGWTRIMEGRGMPPSMRGLSIGIPPLLPNPLDLNTIQQSEIAAGIHDPKNHELRIKWVFCLRNAVEHRCPLNKLGQPVISTIDQLCATPREKAIAFINTVKSTTK